MINYSKYAVHQVIVKLSKYVSHKDSYLMRKHKHCIYVGHYSLSIMFNLWLVMILITIHYSFNNFSSFSHKQGENINEFLYSWKEKIYKLEWINQSWLDVKLLIWQKLRQLCILFVEKVNIIMNICLNHVHSP